MTTPGHFGEGFSSLHPPLLRGISSNLTPHNCLKNCSDRSSRTQIQGPDLSALLALRRLLVEAHQIGTGNNAHHVSISHSNNRRIAGHQ